MTSATSRRRALRVALVAAGVLTLAPTACAPDKKPQRPNVLVIVTDDQRWDTLSAMPQTVELLARQGVRFRNAIVTTPLCCPSRASIYSGKYAHNHRVWDNDNTTGRLDTSETLQRVLHRNGYFTAHVDRYLNNWQDWTSEPPDFDLYAVQLSDDAWKPRHVLVNGNRRMVSTYTTRWVGDMATGFIRRFEAWNDRRPWLTFVTTRAPHLPAVPEPRYKRARVCCWDPPPSVAESLADKPWLRDLASSGRHEAAGARRRQLRSLLSVDDAVGRLVRLLDRLDELHNTLIIFTSDNGQLWGEHGLDGKRWPYDESLRVPLLLRWDARGVAPGTVRTDVVANIDIAPTIYEAVDTSPPYAVDGESLLSGSRRRAILIEFEGDPDRPDIPRYVGVWTPKEVFLRFPDTGHNEFYAAGDRFQLNNLYRSGDGPAPGPYARRIEAWRGCAGGACP